MAKWVSNHEVLAEDLRDPVFREQWEKTALARAVATALVRYRAEQKLSQRALAKQLGMPAAQIGRLELGEHNPSMDMLQRLAGGLGRRFVVEVLPAGQAPLLPKRHADGIVEDMTLAGGVRVIIAAK